MNFQKKTLGAAVAAAFAVAEQSRAIDETVITASRLEMPLRRVGSTISVTSGEEIEARGHVSLVDVLRTEPGVSVTSNGGLGKSTSLRIRGESGFRTLVLVDGVDVSDPTGPQAGPQIQHILASGIERVEILPGPQGMVYGADAGGVINIITRRPDQPLNAGINLEQGRYGTERASASIRGKVDILDYSLSVSDVASDGFNARDIDPTEDRDGYENTTVNALFAVSLGDEWDIELAARNVSSESGFDGFGAADNQDRVSNFERRNYKVNASYKAGGISHQLSYGYTEVGREDFASGVSSFATGGSIGQLQYLGGWDLDESSRLIVGSDWQKEDIIAGSGAGSGRSRLGVYAEWQGAAGSRFFYTAGLRAADSDDFGRHHSIRLTSAYLLPLSGGDELKFKASYGSGFRAPSLSELAYNGGPFASGAAAIINLTEEESEGFDIGVEYLAADGARAELVYFDQEIEDEIFFDLASFSGYLQDTGLSRSRGVEINGEYPLTETIAFTGNYSYTSSRDIEGNQRRRVPTELYNAGLRVFLAEQKLRLSASMRWVRDVADGAVQLDDYQVLDITANYQATDALSIYARAENLLDEEYQEINTYHAPRAAFYGGLRYNF